METIVTLLNDKGLKATAQRIAIYNYLYHTHAHPKAETIYESLRPSYPSLSLATVYKTLDCLQKAGLVSELHIGDDSFRYDANIHPHPHLQCMECGDVIDIDPRITAHLLDDARAYTDCELLSEKVYFYGVCPHCKAKRDVPKAKEEVKGS